MAKRKKSKFVRVMEPERARDGDIVVLPAAERRLRLAPTTWADLGLSIGETNRSDNSWDIVSRWLPKNGTGPRAFLLVRLDHCRQESYEESLLGISATGVRKIRDPELYAGHMVPLSVCNGWTPEQAVMAVDAAYDCAVRKALARIGVKGLVVDAVSDANPGSVPDVMSTLIYDNTDRKISGLADEDGDWCASDRYPMTGPDDTALDAETLPLNLAACWYEHSKDDRLFFRKGFLTNVVSRGGLVLRPDEAFVSNLVESLAAWWADEMARRFKVRADMDRRAAKAMAEAARRDSARMGAWSSLARGCRRRALALPSMVESLEAST